MYSSTSVFPSQEELFEQVIPISKNIIQGPYINAEEYLNIHFLLLREDFISCLREGLEEYSKNGCSKAFDIYENVRIETVIKRYTESYKLHVKITGDDSKKFMNGSLLIFTGNNFRTCIFARVAQKTQQGDILVDCTKQLAEKLQGFDWKLAESTQYFEPYFHVLTALKATASDDFPMARYIIDVDMTAAYLPQYLLNKRQYYRIGTKQVPIEALGKLDQNWLQFDDRQFEAFMAALSQEFVIIQGPPGTGKTYLGVKIIETLLQNSSFWYHQTPILIIAQKNFALDQFLEGVVTITDQVVRVGGQSKSEKLKEFNINHGVDMTKHWQKDAIYLTKMRKALVVGMTTTIAARWKHLLQRLKPPIVLVEEAAEVLEAHIVAALTPSCQHLILLGDHKQLQPMTGNYTIGKTYHLQVSLFERMVNNGIKCITLDTQHRMRPEISTMLRETIYPFLKDHPSVFERPSIQGMVKNVFFLHHKHEETAAKTSKRNLHEAEFLVSLARYLMLNGYKTSDMVILTTYSGQLDVLNKLIETPELEKLRVYTLDAFQGREADIVLFSLVRSKDIGFLSNANRICVGLSRAKNGFFLIGNMKLLSMKSKLWKTIERKLIEGKQIGTKLSLYCCQHPTTITTVQGASDFSKVKNGGCEIPCYKVIDCHHVCKLSCHSKYKEHECIEGCKLSFEKAPSSILVEQIEVKPYQYHVPSPVPVTPSQIHYDVDYRGYTGIPTPRRRSSILHSIASYVGHLIGSIFYNIFGD